MKKATLFVAGVMSICSLFAQTPKDLNNGLPPHRTCGTDIPDQAWEQWFSAQVQEYQDNMNAGRASLVNYTIPVIIHIIHSGGAVGSGNNITLAQAQSEIAILNNDYAGTNADIGSVPSTFTGVKAGNTGIQFCLAKVSPTGAVLAEQGVERISYVARGWTDPNSFTDATSLQNYFDGTIKPATIWDPTKYLNVWVSQMDGSGLLGYASFPAGTGLTGLSGVETATTSGVVINEKSWGNIGTAAAAPYNKGRTATHEIGHWLGLRHIWGDANCATDYCNDTPTAQTSNFGCPTHPFNVGVCTGNTTGEMFMNYMDYVDDACMYMFTANQAARMQTTMANGTYRVGLNTSGKCNTPFALDAGISNIITPLTGSSSCANTVIPKVTITNFGSATLTSAQIKYSYDGGAVSTFAWTGSLASGASANVTLPSSPVLTVAAHTFTAATNAPNAGTDANTPNDSQTSSFTVISAPAAAGLPFVENFEAATFPPTGWSRVSADGAGVAWGTDGIHQWERRAAAGNTGSTSGCAAINDFAYNTAGTPTDDLISKTVSLSGVTTATMTFKVAYKNYNSTTNFDSLKVFVSTDCGGSYGPAVYAKSGTALASNGTLNTTFTPAVAADWRTETVNLSAYAGQSIIVKWVNYSNYGNNLYVDDVNITGSAGGSPPVANFSATPLSVCAGQSVAFTDLSTNTPTSWAWTFTGGTPASSTTQNPTIVYNTPGTYSVSLIATNASGSNTATQTNYITVKVVPAVPTAGSNTPVCAGSAINLTASTVAGATYAWTGPSTFTSTTQNPVRTGATAAMAGTYSVTSTIAGCTSAAGTTAVVVTTAPVATFSYTGSTYCKTAANPSPTFSGGGVAGTFTSTAGLVFVSATTGVINLSASTAGTYTVTNTVAASGGCPAATATSTVTITAAPVAAFSYTASPYCKTGTNPSPTFSGGGVAGTFTSAAGLVFVSASTGVINLSASTAGTYTVTNTIAAAGGCVAVTATSTVTITAPSAATFSYTGSPYCKTAANPSPTFSGGGVAGTFTSTAGLVFVSASTGQVNLTTSTAGTYTVTNTIPASGACAAVTATATITITAAPVATFSYTGTPFCKSAANPSPTFSGGGAAGTFTSTAGLVFVSATTGQVNLAASTAGTYTVTNTIAAAGGCAAVTATSTIVVKTTPAAPTAGSNSPVCSGSSINLTASTVAGATYSWTGPSTFTSTTKNPTRTNSTTAMAGTYSVTAISGGCSSLPGTTTVVVNPTPAAPTASTSAVCTGSTISLTASTVVGATYAWTGPATFTSTSQNPTRTNATAAMAGTYSVTATAGGCTSAAGTTALVVHASPTAQAATTTGASCSTPNGTITLGATTGGTSPYTFSVNSSGFTTTTSYTGFAPGSFPVIVQDANGCQFSTTAIVSGTTGPSAQAVTTVNATCGNTNGVINVGATTGGTGPYTFSVNGGAFSSTTSYTAMAAGSYPVVVKDVNGCQFTTSVTITGTSGPSAQAVTTLNSTCGNANGTVNVGSTTGGTSPYTYSVNGGAFASATTYTMAAGTYPVIVQDANGCQFTTSATIANTAGPTAQATTTANETCGNSNAGITVGATTGGTAPYMYSVNGSAFASTTAYTGMAAGTYPVVVQDANACQFTTSATITNTAGPSAQATTTVDETCGNANGSVTVGATTGGTAPYMYSVNGSAFASTTSYTGMAAGTYPVVVQDANGCQFTTSTTITNTAGPSAVSVTTGNSTCEGTDGTINTGAVTGGTGPYTYSVDGSASTTTTSYTGFAAATYPVIVTDANGCQFSTTATVSNTGTVPSTPTITLVGSDLVSSSPTGNQWYVDGVAIPGANGQNYTFTTNGNYTVIVTTGGCSSAESAIMPITNVGIGQAGSANPYGLSVYPNPNDGHFTISFNSAIRSEYKVEIMNSLGQLVFRDDVKDFTGTYNKELSVVEFGQGIYTISLTNAKNETVKKIIVY